MSPAERGPTIAVIGEAVVALDATLLDLVEAVRAIPYGRPSERTVDGMLRQQRGTCSTKHLFLARVLAERFPDTAPRIIHRVYTLNQTRARELFGSDAEKRALEERHCDPAIREPFIAALSSARRE